MFRLTMAVVVALVLVAGCGGSGGGEDAGVEQDACDGGSDPGADPGGDPGVDAGSDAGADTGMDAGHDAGGDTGQDAGLDAGGDPGTDAGTDAGPDAGADAGWDAGQDAGSDAGGDAGSDAGQQPESHGWEWVRSNPMFLSALTVSMGPPPEDFVNQYFDGFHANAVHLWQDGLPNELNGWAAAGHPSFRWVSWTLADGRSGDGGQLAGGLPPDSPGRIGYQLSDEPRTWEEFVALQEGFEALRAHDPDALLILNFTHQADEIEQMIESYGTQMDGDIVCYDSYTRSNGSYEWLAQFRRAGLDHGMPYWRYMNSYFNSDMDFRHDESDQRWDAFSGLVFGYTGHTWFVYQIASVHEPLPLLFEYGNAFDAPRTEHWDVMAQINQEMLHLGRAITQLTSTDVRYVPTLDFYLPDGLAKWEPGAGDDPYITSIDKLPDELFMEILVGFFRDATGAVYVMVQNVRHEHGDFPIDNSDPGTIRIEFDFSEAPPGFDKTSVLGLNKLDGQVETVPLTSTQGDTGTLDVTLDAGDPFLFKYNNGSPFALGP